VAARAGIAYTAYGSAAGNYVTIDHQDGFRSIYMHLSGFTVGNGTIVSAGQQIGTTGSTGVSTGDHLHFEVLKKGSNGYTNVNPYSYIFK
jgi:murein DD-endopeptidase MepM/ murein hydrolase activator NlpD